MLGSDKYRVQLAASLNLFVCLALLCFVRRRGGKKRKRGYSRREREREREEGTREREGGKSGVVVSF